MSVQALSAVLDHSESTKGTRLTAISIANHLDKNGVGWLSVRLAAEEAKLEERAVKYAVKKLRELGELVVLVEAEGRTHRPPLYWLNLPGLSGDCPGDHPYFVAYGPRAEIAPGPTQSEDPDPGADSAPGGVQDLHDPGAPPCTRGGANDDSGLYREPSIEPDKDPDDGKPSPGTLSNLLADLVAQNDPDGKRPTVTKAWLNAERLMLDRDGREYDVAERLIRWTLNDGFWKANVQSMPKFREQYGRLFLRASRQGTKKRREPKKPDDENPYDAGTQRSE